MGKLLISVLIVTSVVASIILDYNDSHWYHYSKPLTTILIIAYAFIFRNPQSTKYSILIILALFFCLLGDVLLLDSSRFVFGLGAFLIGHILFALAFISLGGLTHKWLPLIFLLFVGGLYFYYLMPNLQEMVLPVGIYILVILFMAWQAMGLAIAQSVKVYHLIAVGAILFAISDSIIAYSKFINPFKLSGVLVLSTYWLAIFIFAHSTSCAGSSHAPQLSVV